MHLLRPPRLGVHLFIFRWETEILREREALWRERWFQTNGRLLAEISAPRNTQLCRLHVNHLHLYRFSLQFLIFMFCLLFDFFRFIDSWPSVFNTFFFLLLNIWERFRARSTKVFVPNNLSAVKFVAISICVWWYNPTFMSFLLNSSLE